MSNKLANLIDEACGRARGDDGWKAGFLLSTLEQILDALEDTSFNGAFRLRVIKETVTAAISRVKGGAQ